MKVYIGWDGRDALAYAVAVASLKKHSSIPLTIIPLKDWDLRQKGVYWRPYHTDERGQRWDGRDGKPFSTDFSFSRFCVPAIEDYQDEWVLFTDPDVMWRADIADLVNLAEDGAVYCVQHDHRPKEHTKMGGVLQTLYKRKNWSSVMLLNPAQCRQLTRYAVNNQSGEWLHAMCWVADEDIRPLPNEWNWLCGWSTGPAKLVHFTRGTPDMPGCDKEPYAREWRRYAASIGGLFNGCQVGGSKRAR